jgi:hypothetical protein
MKENNELCSGIIYRDENQFSKISVQYFLDCLKILGIEYPPLEGESVWFYMHRVALHIDPILIENNVNLSYSLGDSLKWKLERKVDLF